MRLCRETKLPHWWLLANAFIFFFYSNLSVFRYSTFPLTQHSFMDVRAADQCWQDQALWSKSSGPVWHVPLSAVWRHFSHGMFRGMTSIWNINIVPLWSEAFFQLKNSHFDLCVSCLITHLNPSFVLGMAVVKDN